MHQNVIQLEQDGIRILSIIATQKNIERKAKHAQKFAKKLELRSKDRLEGKCNLFNKKAYLSNKSYADESHERRAALFARNRRASIAELKDSGMEFTAFLDGIEITGDMRLMSDRSGLGELIEGLKQLTHQVIEAYQAHIASLR